MFFSSFFGCAIFFLAQLLCTGSMPVVCDRIKARAWASSHGLYVSSSGRADASALAKEMTYQDASSALSSSFVSRWVQWCLDTHQAADEEVEGVRPGILVLLLTSDDTVVLLALVAALVCCVAVLRYRARRRRLVAAAASAASAATAAAAAAVTGAGGK